MIHLNIDFTDDDKLESEFVISYINTVYNYLNNPGFDSNTSKEIAMDYIKGICLALMDAKDKEFDWRMSMSHKYDIPYNFIYRGGNILIEEK